MCRNRIRAKTFTDGSEKCQENEAYCDVRHFGIIRRFPVQKRPDTHPFIKDALIFTDQCWEEKTKTLLPGCCAAVTYPSVTSAWTGNMKMLNEAIFWIGKILSRRDLYYTA